MGHRLFKVKAGVPLVLSKKRIKLYRRIWVDCKLWYCLRVVVIDIIVPIAGKQRLAIGVVAP